MSAHENANVTLNPFLNHLIIGKIITYTSGISELKALRLVSTQWNQLVTPKLFKSSSVNLKCQKEMTRYVKHFGDLGTPPHWNFHWKAAGIDLSCDDHLLKRVLRVAKELHISKGLITRDDLMEILEGGHNLRTISFNEVFVEHEDHTTGEGDLLPHQDTKKDCKPKKFTVMNNLFRLEVTSCAKDDNFPWSSVLPCLPRLRVLHAQLQSSAQVTSLLENLLENQVKLEEFSCFLVDMTEEHLQLLACLEMPLKVLDISLSSGVSSSAIEGLLGSKSCKHLVNLKLFKEADCGEHKNYFGLPQMTSLKSLEILGDPVEKIFTTVRASCPSLESLNLSELSCRDVMSQNFNHFKLTSLCIEECFFPISVLAKLADTFPGLEKLCLFLNDDNVGVVFQRFARLEELTILGTEISDEGITGGRYHHGAVSDRPYIGDCKRLRMLNLYPQPLPGITDACIHHGLLFVSELTSLSLPETAITDKGLRCLLRANHNLVRLCAKIFIDLACHEHRFRSTKYQLL